MATIRVKGLKLLYAVYDHNCLGRSCLHLGEYQARGGTPSGSRNTGQTTPCCLTRAYHGCPYDPETKALYTLDLVLLQNRKRDGMKLV